MTPRKEILADGVELWLGDCRDVLPELDGIGLVVTSPPYNQMSGLMRSPSGSWAQSSGGRGFVEKWQTEGYQDDLPEQEYQDRQNNLFAAIRASCSPTSSLFYNHQLRWRDGVLIHPVNWFQPEGWRGRAEIIWDRCGGMMMNARMFCRYDERVLWFTASDKWKWNQSSTAEGTIWRIPPEQNKEHPVSYPIELPTRCIRASTDVGDLVFDPFMGGGTSGIAAVRLGRRFVGCEIEPKYFEIARKRIQAALDAPDMFVEQPKPAVQEALL